MRLLMMSCIQLTSYVSKRFHKTSSEQHEITQGFSDGLIISVRCGHTIHTSNQATALAKEPVPWCETG
ncbi:hypothetical protein JTE90_024115 [Oedothorax gibbosus]|uniref:Uncharacterized protein n=1 Tax=Oedothorax gibbosus TaxID=931172 RepID=A0AAV6USU3_9ARAC|nr:hypothetical protein JTE90_024115 [Oedothorax gibbosus]